MLREALAYESEAFDADEPISGADLVDWFVQWRNQAKAALQSAENRAVAALRLAEDEPMRFRNYYRHCDEEWEDTWSCACNSRCPTCDAEIEPYDYEALDAEGDSNE
jgi:hypothetical protein